MNEKQEMAALRRVAYTADKILFLARSVSMNDFGWEAWELLLELKNRLTDLREIEEEAAA